MKLGKDIMMNYKNRLMTFWRSRLYVNSFYIMLASVSSAAGGFLFWTIASRMYPSSIIGTSSAVISGLNLVMMVSLLGLNVALIRFYPEYQERALATTLIVVSIAGLLVSITYLGITSVISDELRDAFSFLGIPFLFILFSVIGAIYRIFETSMIVQRRGRDYLIQSMLFSIRFLFLPIFVPFGVLGILSAFGSGLVLGVIYVTFLVFPFLKGNLKVEKKYLSYAFIFSLANYIALVLKMAPTQIMPMIVLDLVGPTETAYYYIAMTVGNMVLLVPTSLNLSFFVEGSYGGDLKRMLKKIIGASYVYLVVMVAAIWILGSRILGIFGEGYIAGLKLLKVVAFSGFFVTIVEVYISLFNIYKKVGYVVFIMLIRAIIYLYLSYMLILLWGILGVGYAWLITHIILAIVGTILYLNQ